MHLQRSQSRKQAVKARRILRARGSRTRPRMARIRKIRKMANALVVARRAITPEIVEKSLGKGSALTAARRDITRMIAHNLLGRSRL